MRAPRLLIAARLGGWVAGSACLLLVGCAPTVSAPRGDGHRPMRIVSINPCIDAVLMEVADPGQIAAISRYSHDSRATSVPLGWARRYPGVDANADAIVSANPDLVLAGAHVASQTIDALKRLGVPIVQYPVADSIADNQAQIAAIAQITGHKDRGAALNARIDAALVAARWQGQSAPALIWQGSGLVPGAGTLADELLARTGFANLARAIGHRQWDIVPLEAVLTRPPQVLFAGEATMGAGAGSSDRLLSHPALRKAARAIRIAPFPARLLHCGGPTIIAATARLAEVRRELAGAVR